MNQPFEFRLPADEFRALPIPYIGQSGRRPKSATFYVRAEDLPPELENWLGVNPRIPTVNKRGQLTGSVAKAMIRQLDEDPDKFVVKNQGITLNVEKAEFEKESGGQGIVKLRLRDSSVHGILNGGHTFLAIREALEGSEQSGNGIAYVRVNILELDEKDADLIPEIAEGLNRSMQVDDPSLANLEGAFDEIKQNLAGKPGYKQIAYRQGDIGEVDILEVLTYLGMLDINKFPDRKTHPNILFGHPKIVLNNFIEDLDEEKNTDSSFKRLVPHVHEILVLTDRIQQLAAPSFARFKAKEKGKDKRAGAKKHKDRDAHFAGGKIQGAFALGWLYPMLAAFRANISPSAWKQGKFEWLADDIEDVLNSTIEEMIQVVQQEHKDNNSKPAEVGRKEAAYRGCYGIMLLEMARRGFIEALASR